jgi:molybdopterin/thiamine biosynthesis adenylyltransferase
MLSKRELARYERQILIPEWTKVGQEKLKKAKVLVAGAGGLGSVILTYLAVVGVGRIKIIDGGKEQTKQP